MGCDVRLGVVLEREGDAACWTERGDEGRELISGAMIVVVPKPSKLRSASHRVEREAWRVG